MQQNRGWRSCKTRTAVAFWPNFLVHAHITEIAGISEGNTLLKSHTTQDTLIALAGNKSDLEAWTTIQMCQMDSLDFLGKD